MSFLKSCGKVGVSDLDESFAFVLQTVAGEQAERFGAHISLVFVQKQKRDGFEVTVFAKNDVRSIS